MRVPAAIRPATPAHLAGIAALLVATFAPELEGVERASRLAEDATGLRHRLADNLLLVATPDDSEDVVGCVEVYTPAYLSRVAPDVEASKLRPYVASLCVQPEHRGRGIGRALVEAAVDEARPLASELHLQVEMRNSAALALYKRCGFKTIGIAHKEMQVMLSRDLSPPPLDPPPPPPPPPPPYARTTPPRCCAPSPPSRSTARIGEEEAFAAGRDERRARLHAELGRLGLDVDALLDDPSFRGSAALRTYTSFVLPKSAGALANVEKPQRAATIASSIGFLVREHRAAQAEWLRNHDRALSESEALAPPHPLTLVLDNVRSAANVGNMFRAAEAARIERVICCGITPTPPDEKLLKTAMGSAAHVPHSHEPTTLAVVRRLQAEGVAVWAAETTARSVAYHDAALPQPLALVMGNELIGVDTEVVDACDGVVAVPTYGLKNSLNVATASTVLMWEALRQWRDAS